MQLTKNEKRVLDLVSLDPNAKNSDLALALELPIETVKYIKKQTNWKESKKEFAHLPLIFREELEKNLKLNKAVEFERQKKASFAKQLSKLPIVLNLAELHALINQAYYFADKSKNAKNRIIYKDNYIILKNKKENTILRKYK